MTASNPVTAQIGGWQRNALLAGIAGVLASIAGLLLIASSSCGRIYSPICSGPEWGIGCLGILLLHHTVGGKWGMLIRRMCRSRRAHAAVHDRADRSDSCEHPHALRVGSSGSCSRIR